MWTWVLDALESVMSYIVGALRTLGAFFEDLFWAVIDVADGLLEQLISFLIGLIPTGVKDYLNDVPWSAAYTYLDEVNWVVPIYALAAVVLAAYGLAGTLRLLRWIKSFVPTISG